MKKVILVTGVSSGLGLSLTVKLASCGHIVYATMRNLQKKAALQEALNTQGVHANLLECDVASTQSVENSVKTIIDQEGRIDCLINNAGRGFIKTTEQASEQDIADVLNTNFMGVVRTTKAVLPHMRQKRSGHIINISSVGGLIGQPFNEVYCASKFAVEGYTESLACYVQPFFNIAFSLIEPGGIQSQFVNNILSDYSQQDLDEDYKPVLARYLGSAQDRAGQSDSEPVYQSSDEVANCVIEVLNSKNPPLRVRTSNWARDFCQLKTQVDPDGTLSVERVYKNFLDVQEESTV
ncbi:SDR family oxidoreductase [Legionella spiritensis]|uniref:Short chain dehydrogenase/reductase family oxidoreductase n=1 Tax=Legionella spiritensis TaxID=452 RepID=A0A0W0YXC7_LEGSP|nr:SDR family oxidoreductase [Legionella spiritensis]KTD61552.1 short chain dehydrogenase/reductase family oxidoreductase [Legionella spiritensis]SNV32540.1 retinol dehydrogenase [Legionella spiritensis]